jgi:hypothetical protein
MIVAPGTTALSIDVQIVDDTGLAVTGLVASTFPSVSYSTGTNAAATSVTLSDISAITTAFTSGGIKERSGGWYRLDMPNAAISAAGRVTIIADASGKHLIAPFLDVQTPQVNILQIGFNNLAGGVSGRGLTQFDADYYNESTLASAADPDASGLSAIASAVWGAATRTVTGNVTLNSAQPGVTFTTLTVTGAFSVNGVSSVSQTGDSFARIGATGSGLTTLANATNLANLTTTVGTAGAGLTALANASSLSAVATAIANFNNLSAIAVIYGPTQMEVPASGSIAYPLTMLVKDAEGHLLDLSASPTITAANAAGTSRSGNLSAVTHAATGQYTFTYTVASAAAQEGISITGTGTASSDSTNRVAILSSAIVAVDTTATLAAIKAKTDNLPAVPASTSDVTTAETAILTAIGNVALSNASLSAVRSGLATGQNVSDAANETMAAVGNISISNVSLGGTQGQTLSDLHNMTLNSGHANASFTAGSLALAPSGSANITITPTSATVSTGEVIGGSIVAYQNAIAVFAFSVADATGTPINLAGKTVRFAASPRQALNDPVIVKDNATAGGLSISGTGNSTVTVTLEAEDTAKLRLLSYSLWDVTDETPLAKGSLEIQSIAQEVS